MKRGPGYPAGHFLNVSEGARLIVLPMDHSGWQAAECAEVGQNRSIAG